MLEDDLAGTQRDDLNTPLCMGETSFVQMGVELRLKFGKAVVGLLGASQRCRKKKWKETDKNLNHDCFLPPTAGNYEP
jgi:hypothetical protein